VWIINYLDKKRSLARLLICCPLCKSDGVLKEAGNGERADAARDGREERTLPYACRVGITNHFSV
jgi:hypothetical protein